MPQKNLVSFKIPEKDLNEVSAAIAVLREKLLPGLISLKPEERKQLPKMGDKSVAFVQKALEYCRSNPDIVPPFLDVDALQTDVKAVETFRNIYQPLLQIADALNDTMLLTGSEAYTGALIYYGAAKTAARARITGAKTISQELSERFAGRNKPGTPAATETIQ